MTLTVGAIILAAGFGTRLAPLTDHTPKPLLEVGGQPVASHLVDRLRELPSLAHIVTVVNDRHRDQWGSWQTTHTATPPISVVSNGVLTDEERLGAVADLALGAEHLIEQHPTIEWVIVLAGDNLLDEPLQTHLDAAGTAERPVVLCRDLGDDVPAGRFGEITVDPGGVITRFREKPAAPESPLAATCSYVLHRQAIDSVNDYLGRGGDPDSPGTFVGWLAEQQPVLARTLTGQYHDIGNHETLAQARSYYR